MKKNIKKLTYAIIVVFVIMVPKTTEAQRDYASGIGVRSWPYWGITYKHFVTDQTSLEFIVSSKWEGLMLDGLYEFHYNAFNTSNFNVLYGFGGHVGWWQNTIPDHPLFDDRKSFSVGVNAIGGIEYSFDEIPFSVSLDWKPLLLIGKRTGISPENISFSVRYNIK